jgi:branched-chain amino acid transport system ATP-binding protein
MPKVPRVAESKDSCTDVTPVLEVQELHKAFGGLVAINRLSFKVNRGEILAIIGPNGAGKTTLFNMINRFQPVSAGEILFEGQSINELSPPHVAALGIARTFQLLQIFSNMSVVENVMVGRHLRSKGGILATGLLLPYTRREERSIFEEAMSKLAMVGLKGEAFSSPLSLPFGRQKTLEIARALAMEPKVLLIDEPAGGLSTREIEQLGELIKRIRDDGVTILLVEHRMQLVMDIADRLIVLNYGSKIGEGTPAEIQSNEEVIIAYLGEESYRM